jgi:hypothetical protein
MAIVPWTTAISIPSRCECLSSIAGVAVVAGLPVRGQAILRDETGRDHFAEGNRRASDAAMVQLVGVSAVGAGTSRRAATVPGLTAAAKAGAAKAPDSIASRAAREMKMENDERMDSPLELSEE